MAGLAGSLLIALVIYAVTCFATGGAANEMLPPAWHFVLLGTLGGIVGQLGDLFASLVKRHCGIKDYSNIFPGHGGMMDRLDSVLFVSVLIYIYQTLVFM